MSSINPNGINVGSGIRFRPPVAAAFLPSDISGLQLWVRSDTGITKDGSNLVAQWDDQSGNARNLSEATNKPLWVNSAINGYPAIRFDGGNDQLRSTSFSVSQPLTVLVVYDIITHTNLDGIWFGNAAAAPGMYMKASPTVSIHDSNTGSTRDGTSTGNYELAKCLFNGTSSTIAINDGSDAATGASFTSNITAGFALGSWGAAAGGRFGNVDIVEFLVYNSAITGTDLTNLKNYFNSRYALW